MKLFRNFRIINGEIEVINEHVEAKSNDGFEMRFYFKTKHKDILVASIVDYESVFSDSRDSAYINNSKVLETIDNNISVLTDNLGRIESVFDILDHYTLYDYQLENGID